MFLARFTPGFRNFAQRFYSGKLRALHFHRKNHLTLAILNDESKPLARAAKNHFEPL